jgi:membrane peptidoglycan carboxypeptidase
VGRSSARGDRGDDAYAQRGANGHHPATGRPDGAVNGYGANGRGADGYGANGSNGHEANGHSANGHGANGHGANGQRRPSGGGTAANGQPAGDWDGQWRSGGPAPGRGDRGDQARGGRDDIKARLGAITGNAGPGRPGPARRGADDRSGYPDQDGYDSFDDISGYREPSSRSPRGTAVRDREAMPATGTSRIKARRAGATPPGGGSGNGTPPRRKGSWWRRWTWKKAFGVAGALVALVVVSIIAVIWVMYSHTQIPTDVSETALSQSSTVYFANGKTQIGTFSNGNNRVMLNSQQIPAVVKNAVIAAEDRHYYTEGGVSPTGIVRAAWEDLSGGEFQGGSTITQQFVRQYYATIGTQQTASRKIKEIFVAIKLSHERSKDWILTNYLNTVYLGHEAYGVGAGAQTYFNRTAAKLTVSQSAMLAAMINQPGYFDPDPTGGQAHTALVARWQYVLTNMVRDGAITQQVADAQKFPKIKSGPVGSSSSGYRGYIMQAVRNELVSKYRYTDQQIDTRGLKITTTFSQPLMNGLYKAVNHNLAALKTDGVPLPKYAHVGAVLEAPDSGAILAMYGGPGYTAKHCAKIKCQFNMAMQAREQVGSSFKPYVLAQAVKEGMNVQDSVLDGDEPICVPPDTMPTTLSTSGTTCPAGYFGVNIAGENMGPVSVTQAAAQSSDPAFEDLIHRAGTQKTIDLAKELGVDTKASGLQAKSGEVGIALGTASLTVEEQANTFATLINGGEYNAPHVIAKLSTSTGARVSTKVGHHRVMSQADAADVDAALSYDTIDGTGYPNGVLTPSRPTIGKTGTTDQAQSAFFLGAIRQYSMAVGMFTNQQNSVVGGQSLNVLPSLNGQGGGYGGAWPTEIWKTFMQDQFGHMPVKALPTPDYTGFDKWVQVLPKPKKPKKQPCHNQPICPGHGGGGPIPRPTPTPTPPTPPTPTPPTPGPNPGPTGTGLAAADFAAAPSPRRPAVTVSGRG